jgi:Transposase, Mutator family
VSIKPELTAVSGWQPHQWTEPRGGLRNGRRPRTITTTSEDLELKIPRLWGGSSPRRSRWLRQGTGRPSGSTSGDSEDGASLRSGFGKQLIGRRLVKGSPEVRRRK